MIFSADRVFPYTSPGQILELHHPEIELGPGAARAIKTSMAGKGARGAVRIEIRSSGCCDASLGLRIDSVRDSDLMTETEGIMFVADRETYDRAGRRTISCAGGSDRTGFVIPSSVPPE